MNKLFNSLKNKSLTYMVISGSLCIFFGLVSIGMKVIFYATLGVFTISDIVYSIISEIFVYFVAISLLLIGRQKANRRFLTMAVGLILIYLSVSNFVEGTVNIFAIQVYENSIYEYITLLQYILLFVIGILWLFVLYALCYDFLENGTRRTNKISTLLFAIVVLEIIVGILYIGGKTGPIYLASQGLFTYQNILYALSPIFSYLSLAMLILCTLVGYIDLRYSSTYTHSRYKEKKEKEIEENDHQDYGTL